MQENLLKEIQNSEVEWKELWEVTIWSKKYASVEKDKQKKVSKYSGFLAKELKELASENGNIKILTTNKTNLWTKIDLARNKIHKGEIIAIPNGGNAIVQYYKGEFVTSSDNCIASSSDEKILSNKYLYYFLLNNLALLKSFYHGSAIKHPNMSEVLDIKIPLPTLELQNKIVEILDKFTELQKELQLRKKQYEFYREKLLTFGEEVERKELEKVALIKRGKRLIKSQLFDEEKYPVYQNSIKALGYFNESNVSAGTTFIITAGSAGEIAYSEVDFWAADDCFYFECSDLLENRFLYYVLLNQQKYIYSQVRKASIPRLPRIILEKLKIPLPSLEKQKEIIEILDKFETLTNSINEGLPREIELRQKQYEYYRNLLLTFKS